MPRISVVQFMSDRSIEANMAKAERFIKTESKTSDLIVFPEQFLGGCFDQSGAKEILSQFGRMARDYKIDIVPGSMLTKRNSSTYNTSHYIDSRGRILCSYDKSTPWKSEKIKKGAGPKPFKTRFGNTVMIICWDLSNPSLSSKLARMKVDLIICPSMWWEGSEARIGRKFAGEFIDSLCIARAYECKAVVAYANAAGVIRTKSVYDLSAGRSQITMPFQGASAAAETREEQVISQKVNSKMLAKARAYMG